MAFIVILTSFLESLSPPTSSIATQDYTWLNRTNTQDWQELTLHQTNTGQFWAIPHSTLQWLHSGTILSSGPVYFLSLCLVRTVRKIKQ